MGVYFKVFKDQKEKKSQFIYIISKLKHLRILKLENDINSLNLRIKYFKMINFL
jgi:hypothetical protein